MYANIKYLYKENSIWISRRDEHGTFIEDMIPWKPYLYIKDSHAHDAISIYEEPLRKMEFSDPSSRRKFMETTKKTYFALPTEQQYLIDRFHGIQDADDFSAAPLRTFFLDIEVYASVGFPDPLKADCEITVITIYDTLTNTYQVFGQKCMYYAKSDDVVYHFCHDEKELIKTFLRWWRKNWPDVVSGWYSMGFDIPYICNRINRLYDDEFACARLSPIGKAWHKEDVKKRFGAVERVYDQIWTIDGVTHIDMQAAYYKFSPKKLEKYSLNFVCGAEGLGKKLEHEGSLADWWVTNPQEFIDYNIQDVRLLVNLENKLKYMQLCRNMAHSSLAPLGDSLSTLPIVTGLVALEALTRNRIISTFDNSDAVVNFEGGYVTEPKKGFAKSIVSVDANSLYPSVIRTLNISNETKVGWYETRQDGNIFVKTIKGKTKTMDPKTFVDFIHKADIAISPNGVMFSQAKQGILPSLLERLYAKRKATKKEMLSLEKKASDMRRNHEGTEKEIVAIEKKAEYLDMLQKCAKIGLNSVFGASGEKHYALFDTDISSTITSMGRETIKRTSVLVNKRASELHGSDIDVIVYGDTDSNYLTIDDLLIDRGAKFLNENGNITKDVYEISEDIANYIDREIANWHKKRWNCKNPVVGFKREALAPAGLYVAKKMYCNWVKDDEEVLCDKITYHGLAVVRSSTPDNLKPMIKDMVETMVKTQDRDKVISLARKYWDVYQKMSTLEKAVAIGLNNVQKYMGMATHDKNGNTIPALHTPRQVCCAFKFNDLLVQEGLDKKYEKLVEGDKMKIMYCLPNRFGITSFAFKDKIPTEWENEIRIDDATMFRKTVWSSIKGMFEAVGWKDVDVTLNESCDLESLLFQ